jgi:hypothetical protein
MRQEYVVRPHLFKTNSIGERNNLTIQVMQWHQGSLQGDHCLGNANKQLSSLRIVVAHVTIGS